MGTLRNEVEEKIEIFAGQKSSVPGQALSSSDAEKVLNFYIRKGKLRKAWGAPLYANPALGGSGGISWLETLRHRWIFQRLGSESNDSIIGFESSEGSKIFQQIGSMLGGRKIRSAKWRGNCYLVNGNELKFIESSSELFLNLGLIPPNNIDGSIYVASSNTGGTLVPGVEYRYAITWFDAVRGTESLPAGFVPIGDFGSWESQSSYFSDGQRIQLIGQDVVIGGSDDSVTIDPTALKNAGYDQRVTHFIIYRALVTSGVVGDFKRINVTHPDAGPLYGQGVFPIAGGAVIDTDPDEADLGSLLDLSIQMPPSGIVVNADATALVRGDYGPKFIEYHNDQLWMFGVNFPGFKTIPDSPGEESYVFSPPLKGGVAFASDVSNFDYYKYTYDIARDSDQRDTGIAKFRNTLFFFKDSAIWYLDGTNPTNYSIKEMDNRLGCVAPDSIQKTPVGVIALSRQGFILVDSIGPAQIISHEVFDEVNKINFDYVEKFTSAFDIKEGKYECHVVVGLSQKVNYVFIYDVNFKQWQFSRSKYGTAVKYDLSSSGEPIGLLGDRENNKLYSLVDETEVTWNDQKIRGVWRSKQFDFGNGSVNKSLRLLKIRARSKEDFKISVDIIMDGGQQQSWSIRDVESESAVSYYAEDSDDDDGAEYDEDNYMGEWVSKKFEILVTGVAKNFQIVVRESESNDASSGFEIDEMILSANMLER